MLLINTALNLRKFANKESDVLTVIPQFTILDCEYTSDLWQKVSYNGFYGYINTNYVTNLKTQSKPFELALTQLGTKEIKGVENNPIIAEYLATTTLNKELASQDETAWCSAFVNWCVTKSGLKGTNSAWAKSWLNYSKPTRLAKCGDIAVFKRGDTSGHVAFYINTINDDVIILGGNQSDKVCISTYPKIKLLGIRE